MKTGRDVHKIPCRMSVALKTLSIVTIVFLLTGLLPVVPQDIPVWLPLPVNVSATQRENDALRPEMLNLDDPQDFEDAGQGFIARPTGKIIKRWVAWS